MVDEVTTYRPWRETVSRTVVPFWFALSGIALGVGGVIRDQPLAGACGAVAGVTVGWWQQQRASTYLKHNNALRRRLKKVRAESAKQKAEFEERITALQGEVLEQKLMRMLMNPNAETASELTGEIPAIAAPVDEVKLDEPKVELDEPKVELDEPKVELDEPKVEEPKVEEPKVEEPKVEEPKAGPLVEEPKAEETKAEEPKAEEPKAEAELEEPVKVEDDKPAEIVAEESDAHPGAQVIDLPQKAKAKAKRAQAG